MHIKKIAKLIVIAIGSIVILSSAPWLILAQGDAEPPTISDIQIVGVTEDSATIIWKTDEDADSLINYGLNKIYGIVRIPFADKTSHLIVLKELEPSTMYHFRAVSADVYGNQAVSGDFTFITTGEKIVEGIEDIGDKAQQSLVEKAVAILEEITDPEALKIVQNAIGARLQEVIGPPKIIGVPRVEEITDSTVVILWITDRESNSTVSFVSEDDFDENSSDPYVFSESDLGEFTKEHRLELVGLLPGTTYHFQASSEDDLGLVGYSEDGEFTTKSILPIIRSVEIIKVEETSATIGWTTNIPAAGNVEYISQTSAHKGTKGSPELSVSHTIRILDLEFGTTYSAVVKVKNAGGEEVVSQPLTFKTTKDEFPPIIEKVTNESTLFPGAETKIQTIIAWDTDEPAICALFFQEGIASGVESFSFDKEKEPTTDHVKVVVEFTPSTVYKFWVECTDNSGNTALSEDFVLFTPEKEKSIIDIILENFEGAFGWIKNVGK